MFDAELHIDFETRSAADLKKTGVYIYAIHDSTDVWCASWAIDDGPVATWIPEHGCLPDELRYALEDDGVGVVGHNVGFEWNIIEHVCARRHGWPTITPSRLDCTAARAAVVSIPRDLAGAGEEMGLAVQKDAEGRRLMLQMARPRKVHDDGRIEWWNVPEKRRRLEAYCETDVGTERELSRVIPYLSKRERQLWLLDFEMNHRRGVAVDRRFVQRARHILGHASRRYNKELSALTGGRVPSVTKVANLRKWIIDEGVEVGPSLDKNHVAQLLRRTDLPPNVRRALEIRRDTGKSSLAKLPAFLKRSDSSGLMLDNLMYHGAGTGRWAGRGVQLHNLPRPSLGKRDVEGAIGLISQSARPADADDDIEFLYGATPSVISDCLRGCVIARDGKILRVADFANIEGRVNAWGGGQADKVALFAENGPVYERMASVIYGIPIEQVTKESMERFVGKQSELGCGYGMGWEKFMRSLYDDFGVVIAQELARLTIDKWRETNPKIVQWWYDLEEAAIAAMRTPGHVFTSGPVEFYCPHATHERAGFLLCRLPNGRLLYYRRPEIRNVKTPWGQEKEQLTYMARNSFTNKYERQKTYGGKLCENVVQAISRDLLADAMLRVERHGYPVVLTVHDEIVSEADRGHGSQEEFEQLMAHVPSWASGCPIHVEGFASLRYRK